MAPAANMKYTLKVRVREFGVPPIHDVLVLGKRSPIGCAAIRKAIEFLVASPFEHLEFKDDVISDIISAQRDPAAHTERQADRVRTFPNQAAHDGG